MTEKFMTATSDISVYEIAGFTVGIKSAALKSLTDAMPQFSLFAVDPKEGPDFIIEEDMPAVKVLPDGFAGMMEELYRIEFESVEFSYRVCGDDRVLILSNRDDGTEMIVRKRLHGCSAFCSAGAYAPIVTRFAFWMICNLFFIEQGCAALHSSVIVKGGEASMFLGESGTGKSTHTRLWRENIDGAVLLNDDSPFVRVGKDGVRVYGSPWSGKTPCYRRESCPLKAVVRLKQAPFNRMSRLSPLLSIGALLPSFPPAFNSDAVLSDHVCGMISAIAGNTGVWSLECLPDADAARLSYSVIFNAGFSL